jgi:hypothetical protein
MAAGVVGAQRERAVTHDAPRGGIVAAEVGVGRRERQAPPGRQEPPPDHRCRCVGHRLLLVVGSGRDPSIAAALRWALDQPPANTHHRVWVRGGTSSEPSWSDPQVPRTVRGITNWRDVDAPRGRDKVQALVASFGDCCFLEEVLVIAHGGTLGLYRGLPTQLPRLVGHRVIRKLTIFACSSAEQVHPGFGGFGRHYPTLAGIVAQRRCPCGCDLDACDDAALDPDGGHPSGYRCPADGDSGKLLLAAWYAHGNGFRTSKLGLDPRTPDQPLTSPDGRLREVTVAPDGSGGFTTTATVVANPAVLDGVRVREDRNLRSGDDARFDDEGRRLAPHPATPRPPGRYQGPQRCDHDPGGCLPDTP